MTFSSVRHESRPPDVPELLRRLGHHGVVYVLSGSTAALVHGVELEPGDLDIVPETSTENLSRLVELLRDLEAQPLGPFGSWTTLDTGERKWVPRPTTERELAEWEPDIGDLGTLDHLFVTRLGNFDVVPELTGTYEFLSRRARQMPWQGVNLRLAHIDELLARLTVPRREKDIARVAGLREIQRGR